jgi:hypothetical protein
MRFLSLRTSVTETVELNIAVLPKTVVTADLVACNWWRNPRAIIAGMADPAPPRPPVRSLPALTAPPPIEDKMVCERCGGADMYRMHAVWRCPTCGFKTDCCGW